MARKKNAEKSKKDIHLYTQLHKSAEPNVIYSPDGGPTYTQIHRQLSEIEKKQSTWIDPNTQKIILQPDETPITKDWEQTPFILKSSFWRRVKERFMLFIYVLIYSIIIYFVYDKGTGHIDNAVNAFFFLAFPYILVSYRGIDKYFKAIFVSFFIFAIEYVFFKNGFITYEGMPLIKYFVFLVKIAPNNLGKNLDPTSWDDIAAVHFVVLVMIFILEFIILVIYNLFFKKKKKIDYFLTDKALYIRTRTVRSKWATFVLYVKIAISPFNVKYYGDLIKRIKYNRESLKDGVEYDYARITGPSIEKIKKWPEFSIKKMITGILLVIFGAFIFLPLVFVGIIMDMVAFLQRKGYNVKIVFNREQTEGSWILSHEHNVLILQRMKRGIAQKIVNINKAK